MSEELNRFESVKEWYEGYETGRDEAQRTFKIYTKRFHEFMEFLHLREPEMTPDGYLKIAQEEKKRAYKYVMAAVKWLKGKEVEGYEPRARPMKHNSAVDHAVAVRSFLSYNDVKFGKGFPFPSREVATVATIDEIHTIYDYDERADKTLKDFSNLRRLLGYLESRDVATVLCLMHSGEDAEDVYNLTVGDFRQHWAGLPLDKLSRWRFIWKGKRRKTSINFRTFFSVEATARVVTYLQDERKVKREDSSRDDEPLFTKLPRKGNDQKRMDVHVLSQTLLRAARLMNHAIKGHHNPWRPKRFRHIFRDACAMARIDSGFTHVFMGHKSDQSGEYLDKPVGMLLSAYVRVERLLVVFGIADQDQAKILTEKHELLENQLKFQQDKNEELGAKVAKLETFAKHMIQRFEGLDEAIESPAPEFDSGPEMDPLPESESQGKYSRKKLDLISAVKLRELARKEGCYHNRKEDNIKALLEVK